MNQHIRLMEVTYLLVIRLNAFKDEQEHSINHVHDLVAVVLENHLEIEAGESIKCWWVLGFP